MSSVDLDAIIKAYDVRGVYPDQLDGDLAERLGAAFVQVVGAATRDGGPGAIVVGRDMRPSGTELVARFAAGATSQGVDVIDIGLASTDLLYFASGTLNLPGAMFTASHNPARYNGVKFCRPRAVPVGRDTGLARIRELVTGPIVPHPGAPGELRTAEMLGQYVERLHELVPLDGVRRLRIVVDAANGMAGLTVPAVLARPELTVIPLYFELDGTFPNHEANPLDPANLVDLRSRVVAEGADLGLAFDGDADRCFVVDERGEPVSPSALTALIAVNELARHPGATILHNVITSRAVPEIVTELGGTPVRTEVGHSFIKAHMARTGAVFGGEHSGHYYFADFWNADSGMIAALHVIAALERSPLGTALSTLVGGYERYATSGELNLGVSDPAAAVARVRAAFDRPGVSVDLLDGTTLSGPTWWLNLRLSNTEPLLRLNIEADTAAEMAAIRDASLDLIRHG